MQMIGLPFPNSAKGAGGDFDGAFFDVALELLGREHAIAEDVLPVVRSEKLRFGFEQLEYALVPLEPFPSRCDNTDYFALIKARIGKTNLILQASRNDGLNQFLDPRSRKGVVCLWHG